MTDPTRREAPRRGGDLAAVPALTGFRALAAAMVLVGHLEGHRDVGGAWFLRYGWTGVNLFFALSGFLFTVRYLDAFVAAPIAWREYLVRRAARVLPLAWALVLISYASWPRYTAGDVAAHLTLTQAYFAGYRFTLNPPMWSLCVEESFYLTVPWLLVALGAVERARPSASVAARVAAVSLCLLLLTEAGIAMTGALLDLKRDATGVWDDDLWAMTLTGRFSDFACGIAAGLVALRAGAWVRRRGVSTTLLAAGAVGWCLAAHWIDARGGVGVAWRAPGYQVVGRVFAAAGAAMILGLYGGAWGSGAFASRPVVYAGRISFALYLAQDMRLAEVGLFTRIARSVRSHVQHEALAVAVIYAALSLVAAALHHAIEEPAQRAVRRRFASG